MKTAGIILIGVAVLFIIVGRWNYSQLGELGRTFAADSAAYEKAHPIETTFFGPPVASSWFLAKYQSTASFAYSFTPPLCLLEIIVYAALLTGIVLVIRSCKPTNSTKGTVGP